MATDSHDSRPMDETLRIAERVLESSSALISVVDRNYIYRSANPSYVEMTGRPLAEIIGHHVSEILGEEVFRTLGQPGIDRCFTGDTVRFEAWIDYPAAGRRFMGYQYFPIWKGAEVEYVAVMARDITEFKRLEDHARRLERLETVASIAAGVAHDFNNLLSPLTMYPELIKLQLPPDHPARAYCDAMLASAQQMADINMDMIALSRTGHVDHQLVDLNGIVEQAIKEISDSQAASVIRLSLAAELETVMGSFPQLRRMAANLLANAIEAAGHSGKVIVSTGNTWVEEQDAHLYPRGTGPYVRLSVSDNGSGISEETLPNIFDPFFSTKNMVDRRGSGLGLTIVQAVVRDHRGRVQVESKKGKGSTFIVYLPAASMTERSEGERSAASSAGTILVVDDDPLQREVLQVGLSNLGYHAETASGAKEAIAFLSERRVDLLVLDMVLPGDLNGAELYRQALQIRPNQRAILISGYEESDKVSEARALGASILLRKPIDLKSLAQAVSSELKKSPPPRQ